MSNININDSIESVTISIIFDNRIALSEMSVFPKEIALDMLKNAELNKSQKDYVKEAINLSDKVYFYSRLNVPKQIRDTVRGTGTKLLEETLKFVKEKNAFLMNTANAYGEKSQEELISFYQKAGMTLIHKDGWLIYSPNLDPEHLNNLKLEKKSKKKV